MLKSLKINIICTSFPFGVDLVNIERGSERDFQSQLKVQKIIEFWAIVLGRVFKIVRIPIGDNI